MSDLLPPVPGILTNQDVRRWMILHPNGTISMVVSTESETITVDPATGSRCFRVDNTLFMTVDGMIISDPLAIRLYWCVLCARLPFSVTGVVLCACGKMVCRQTCLKRDEHGGQCAACATKTRWERFKEWLCKLPS